MKDEKIRGILRLYKNAVLSYSWENHYLKHIPLEQGFDRKLMDDPQSSLYDDVSGLFRELRTSQAQRYIAEWERIYIIDGWCADDDKVKYDSLQAIGKTFIEECKRIAAEACEPEEFTQRGGGIDHPTKVQQIKAQTEPPRLENLLPKELDTDEAKALFDEAEKLGLIKTDGSGRKLGRKKIPVQDLILLNDKDAVFKKLQENMKGKSENAAMAILINNIKNEILLKPSWKSFCDAFPDVEIKEATYYYRLRKAKV